MSIIISSRHIFQLFFVESSFSRSVAATACPCVLLIGGSNFECHHSPLDHPSVWHVLICFTDRFSSNIPFLFSLRLCGKYLRTSKDEVHSIDFCLGETTSKEKLIFDQNRAESRRREERMSRSALRSSSSVLRGYFDVYQHLVINSSLSLCERSRNCFRHASSSSSPSLSRVRHTDVHESKIMLWHASISDGVCVKIWSQDKESKVDLFLLHPQVRD